MPSVHHLTTNSVLLFFTLLSVFHTETFLAQKIEILMLKLLASLTGMLSDEVSYSQTTTSMTRYMYKNAQYGKIFCHNIN